MAKSVCGQCKVVFTGLTAFDKHQSTDKSTGRHRIICASPEAAGLVPREGKDLQGESCTAWGFPQPDEKPKHFNVAPAAPKTYTCECGRKFQGTGKKGRPPKSCTECGGKGKVLA